MAVNLSPVGGVAAQFFTNTGAVLTGGKIYTYAAGTTTPQSTYTSGAGNVAWTNPIVLDAAGRVPSSGEIWLTDGSQYKFVLKDSNDVLIATYDNITGINSNFVNFVAEQEIQTATAGQTVFTLTTTEYQPGTNTLSVFVDGVNQYGPGAQYAYIETSSTVVTFVSGLHVGASVKFTTTQTLSGGAINASQVTYNPAGTGAVATNVQAKLRQYVSVKDFGAVGDGVTDDTAEIQAALNTGFNVFFPPGSYLMSNVNVTTLGQILYGAGMANTNIYMITGSTGFKIQARNVAIRDMQFLPSVGYVPGVQSTIVANCITIQASDSDNSYIEGLDVNRCSFYNIKGVAINMISPLRESIIQNCRFNGMSNKSTGDGVIRMKVPTNTDRCTNNIWIQNNSFYRFAAPAIQFTTDDLGVTGRTQPCYADIWIVDNLIHGQWLDETNLPLPQEVVAEPTDHIYAKCVDNFNVFGNKFAAIHPNYNGVRVDQLSAFADGTNKSVSVLNNYLSYNDQGIVSPTGSYVRVTDGINSVANGNTVLAGYFTYDLNMLASGSATSTVHSTFLGNTSFNQFNVTYNASEIYQKLNQDSLELVATTPFVKLRDKAGAAYGTVSVDSAGSINVEADPTQAVGSTRINLKVDNTTGLSVDANGSFTNYITMVAKADGTAAINTLYYSSTNGKLSFKDSTGTVFPLY